MAILFKSLPGGQQLIKTKTFFESVNDGISSPLSKNTFCLTEKEYF